MDEEKVVQPETASTTEPVSKEGGPQEVKPEPPQPLTAEQIQKMIADETEKVRRTIQSDKDKAIAEVHREAEKRVREAEVERWGIESSLGELDDDTKLKIELAKYRAKDRYTQDSQREEQARLAVLKAYEDFNTNMTQYVTDLGIDPKKVDWGNEMEPLLTKQQRILSQVGKIQKDTLKAEKESVQKTVKEEIAKARRELGLDSVDDSVSVTNKEEYAGIPTKVEEFRQWLAKMPQKDYEDKYADKVNKMRREGLIK